ncbi:hypothetical protein BKA70DRAFT_1226197 [Coprinopsis sp. MPI-PUGE-AT-0042]|nr:hypothetical protein BKA70DRAFT_1226197 [Coprinopsis sp. MPI-PUGE-AT-0042]
MFRATLRQALLSARPPISSDGLLSIFHLSAPAMRKKYNPKERQIVGTAPGNQELAFANVVDGADTWYTPEGMTAAEIMQIPGARRFFDNEEEAEFYIQYMAKTYHRFQYNCMIRAALALSARPAKTSAGLESGFHSSAPAMGKNSKYDPKERRIFPTFPGNQELVFNNVVDRTVTWYTPAGMTASEIMQIPYATKYLANEGVAEWYIEHMAK